MKLNKFINKNILLLGYGVTGQDVYEIIAGHNNVYIVDDSTEAEKKNLNIDSSGDFLNKKPNLDFIIKSPGIRYDNQVLLSYPNTPVINDIEIAYEVIKERNIKTIAITGTNGKTSTTTFLTTLLNHVGYRAFSCGNIGVSPLRVLSENDKIDFLVIELSSFQLKAVSEFKPDYAVFMNFTPDHLDYHHSIEDYFNSKLNIFKNNNANMKIYLGNDIEYASEFDNVAYPNKNLPNEIYDCINGIYYENIELVYPLAIDLGITNQQIVETLKLKFMPLAHRMESVRVINGVEYVNDSKATNVDATSVALKQYKNIILIAGGYDKKEDISVLEHYLTNVKQIICYGENKLQFLNLHENTLIVDTLAEAIFNANKSAVLGDTVLLSPASASYDMFKNYEERGELFRELVERI